MDIIVIAVCAVICGADTWEDIELFGEAKHEWLKQFLELPNGLPSHDTFGEYSPSCPQLSFNAHSSTGPKQSVGQYK